MERVEHARSNPRAEADVGKLPAASEERERFDAYAAITERIIEQLERGVVPWQSPSLARVGAFKQRHHGDDVLE